MKHKLHKDRKSFRKWALPNQRTKSEVPKEGQLQKHKRFGSFISFRTMP